MLFSALFLSCMVAGSFACRDEHCKDPKLANELVDVKFLPNQDELQILCPKVLSFLECEKEFMECPGQSLEELITSSNGAEAHRAKAMLNGMSLVRDLCDEDSSLHQDYVESVDCFRVYLETSGTQCRQDIAKPIEDFFDQIYPNAEEITEEAYAEIRCLTDVLELGCIVDNLGESCGEVAQRTALTGIERMKAAIKAGTCYDVENAADLKARLLDFLELDDVKRSNIQSVFDLIKRRR